MPFSSKINFNESLYLVLLWLTGVLYTYGMSSKYRYSVYCTQKNVQKISISICRKMPPNIQRRPPKKAFQDCFLSKLKKKNSVGEAHVYRNFLYFFFKYAKLIILGHPVYNAPVTIAASSTVLKHELKSILLKNCAFYWKSISTPLFF